MDGTDFLGHACGAVFFHDSHAVAWLVAAERRWQTYSILRVRVARAIVTEPAVLLADEPTANLDTQRSREIMELLWRLNQDQGITVLMVTHEHDMAMYARRMVHFVDGMLDSDVSNPHPLGLDLPPALPASATGGQ